jgi:hypothetical protein
VITLWLTASDIRMRAGKEGLRDARIGVPEGWREILALLIDSDGMNAMSHCRAQSQIGNLKASMRIKVFV